MSVKWHGKQLTAKVRGLVIEGLDDASEYLLETANRTVPVDEGTLLRSGTAKVDKERLVGIVAYDTPYARAVHEDLQARHAEGRRAKWLTLTLDEEAQPIKEHVIGKVKAALK